ncbi:hypothetical protein FB107DRAFT_272727 [Schizophyllum commune]
MEPKLVYRCLRQLSVWVTDNYYSDVVVEGAENVSETGPVILAATHRNESIDVAVLAVTIPHGRQVSYWAKSSLFKHPVLRWVMESSGAIPVQRGAETASRSHTLNNSSTTDNSRAASQTQADLFRASTACLMHGGTLGVFPEGFSATLPGLGDLRSGAAWAAVEHDRAARLAALERGVAWESARIVPVSIVYTDAPAYRSQVHVRYGPAIKTADYYSVNAGEDDLEAQKDAVARMMDAVRDTLQADGINAPDCLVKYLSDEKKWSKPVDEETKQAAIANLARYHALQIHTQISHADLQALIPPGHSLAMARPFPSKFLFTSLLAFLQASARPVLCLPPLVVYLPAYAASYAATTILTRRDQPESQAQVSAIAGGVGLGLGFWGAWRLYGPALGRLCERALRGLNDYASPAVSRNLSQFVGSRVGKLAMGYVALKTLMAWHNLFAEGNRRVFRRCVASVNIFLALMFPGYENTSPVYDAPPAISENAHARRKAQKEQAARDKARQVESGSSTEDKDETAPKNAPQDEPARRTEGRRPWKFTLVRRLVAARREAMDAWDNLQGDGELWRAIR